jgi:hypothetical protein
MKTIYRLSKVQFDVPSKVIIFGWPLFIEKLPTWANLGFKCIIANPNNLPCVSIYLI